MPTLLSINNYYYRRGGAEVVFLEQNKVLEKIGWQVVPFSMQHKHNLDTEWANYFVREIEFQENYSLKEKLVRVPKTIYSREAQRRIRDLILAVNPDISHAHNIYHHISPSILSTLKKHEIPTVLTLHDLKIACPAYKMLSRDGVCERCKGGREYNVLIHRCLKDSFALSAIALVESMVNKALGSYAKNVDRFIVPSRFYLEKMVEWGWDPGRFVHIPNFVDVATHQPVKEAGKKYIYFGRLSGEKGVSTLIKAAALAKVSLMIVGTGPLQQDLESLADSLDVDVEFLGYRSGSELRALVGSARAIVLPSEWYENAPMSVLESYALGKPVIGARIGGIPELIKEDETGIIFESGSIDDLAESLRRMEQLGDSSYRDMGRSARQWVECEFTVDKYRERILGLYTRLGVRNM